MPDSQEIAPKKEKRAFATWVVAALIVLVAGVVAAGYVLDRHHAPVTAPQ